MSDATRAAGGEPVRPKQRAFLPERLYSRFDDARRAPITLLIGEEGLGKSTLIRDYLARGGTPYLRFTAGPEHAAPGDLLRGLARTFGTLSPAMARSCGIAVQKLEAGDGAGVALSWAREHLADVTATVVLDDLHHVLGVPRCASFLVDLIEATIPNVSWILAVRDAGALPVPRWLSSGRCGLPIESDELRIRPHEIVREFERAGVALDDDAAIALCERTQGRPLGLRVALATGRIDGALTREEVYERLVDAAFARCTREQSDRLFELATIGRFDDAVLTALECAPRFRELLDDCELVHAVDDASDALHEPRARRSCGGRDAAARAAHGDLRARGGDARAGRPMARHPRHARRMQAMKMRSHPRSSAAVSSGRPRRGALRRARSRGGRRGHAREASGRTRRESDARIAGRELRCVRGFFGMAIEARTSATVASWCCVTAWTSCAAAAPTPSNPRGRGRARRRAHERRRGRRALGAARHRIRRGAEHRKRPRQPRHTPSCGCPAWSTTGCARACCTKRHTSRSTTATGRRRCVWRSARSRAPRTLPLRSRRACAQRPLQHRVAARRGRGSGPQRARALGRGGTQSRQRRRCGSTRS